MLNITIIHNIIENYKKKKRIKRNEKKRKVK